MYRKPNHAVRIVLKRGFTKEEVEALDRACDLAEAAVDPPSPPAPKLEPAKPNSPLAPRSAPAWQPVRGI